MNGEVHFIQYKSAYPKYLFLHYLIENKNVLVHGSNDSKIRKLEPKVQTLFNGKPVRAVFAASDGVWSMFFAVMNKKDYEGSVRNLCLTLPTKKGIKRYYYFSVNENQEDNCWIDGTIYILPKDRFSQGGIKDEWVCESTIEPISKLSVTQDDFPFLDKVRKHKETESIVKTIARALLIKPS
ncbi:hypothetical protein AB3N04_06740 [Alkalihalophilus sp. As8PL]|uniref:Uncharacterized protein n=1 Tax=Alkalihalophilus sp. As8PL TaxID=3237103 RepID=A0AB39BWT5_9BACI